MDASLSVAPEARSCAATAASRACTSCRTVRAFVFRMFSECDTSQGNLLTREVLRLQSWQHGWKLALHRRLAFFALQALCSLRAGSSQHKQRLRFEALPDFE
jgi:hypothetical protein